MPWEQEGILKRNEDGTVDVGIHCARCEEYEIITLPFDDYSPLNQEKCELCYGRDRLARAIRALRAYEDYQKYAKEYILQLEKEILVFKSIVQSGSQIINGQDEIIRQLRDALEAYGEEGKKKYLDIRERCDNINHIEPKGESRG